MKLEFLTEQTACLMPVLRETRTAEETAEIILPDSCPDIDSVLFVSGLAFFRGKELTEGRATVSVGVSAIGLVQPQEASVPELAEAYIPLSLKLEDQRIRPGMEMEVRVMLRQLDGHLVSPRKVMIRATVSAEITLWERVTQEHLVDTAQKGVYMLHKTAAVRCLRAMGEKNYTVEDVVRPDPKGDIRQIGGIQAELRHTDARLTGTRAVLKGEAELRFLCFDGEGQCRAGTAVLPFSQYIDLGDCEDQDELQLWSCLTGLDAEPSVDGTGVNVTIQILTAAKVWGRREIPYTADLYSTMGDTALEWQDSSYESLLDRQYFTPTGSGDVSGDFQQLMFASCMQGEGSHVRNGELVELTLPVTAAVLWQDTQGALRAGTARVQLEASSRAAEDCRFTLTGDGLAATASPGTEGLTVKVSGTLEVDSYGGCSIREVVGAELTEQPAGAAGPSLMIRRVRPEETLWEIAKAAKTTEAAIRGVNGLSEGDTPTGMLLIPRSRVCGSVDDAGK